MNQINFPSRPSKLICIIPQIFAVLLLSLILPPAATVYAQNPFITTWKTDNPGISLTTQISIPITDSGYDFTINWGDGSQTGWKDGDDPAGLTHTYSSAGTYRVEITGEFPRIFFNSIGDRRKILTIEQWGDIEWGSMEGAFSGASNLELVASDAPDLRNVTNLSKMFRGASNINGNFNSWDVSGVTDMSEMFYGIFSFNGDLSNWNVSGVTNMAGTFASYSFNGDLSNWDVSSVTNMRGMFTGVFNQDISGWNVAAVTDMSYMFSGAVSFNQDISNWDVSSVTTMEWMFHTAWEFNQNLGGWDISNVINMSQMLHETILSTANYDATLTGWAAQNVQNNVELGASGLVYCAETARQSLIDDHNWTITGDAPAAGCGPTTFRPYITTWKTDNPGASDDNQITIMTDPARIYNFFIDWGDGQTNTAVSGTITHTYATPGIYTVKISGDYPRSVSFAFGFIGTDVEKLLSVEQWGDIAWISMTQAFGGAKNMVLNATDAPDLSGVSRTDFMFSGASSMNSDLNHWDVSNVTRMDGMFSDANSFNGDISNWDVSNVTNMGIMFGNAGSFNRDISAWDVSSVNNMTEMFNGAISFNQDISGWDISGIQSDLSGIFLGASAFDQNLGGWDISGIGFLAAFFSNSGMSVENYESTLSGWASQPVQVNVRLGAVGLEYCDDTARNKLIDDFNWNIEGDTLAAGCGVTSEPGIPRLSSPADNAVDVMLPLVLQWEAADNADEYSVQVAEDTGFSNVVAQADSIPETSFELSELEFSTTYYWRVRSHGGGTESDWSNIRSFTVVTATSYQSEAGIPRSTTLRQNYPNPFNPTTSISYDLAESGKIRLEIFDLTGRQVSLLIDKQMPAGRHQVYFDASGLSSGVYIYRLHVQNSAGNEANSYEFTRKLTVIK